ncbi:MAG: CCA tRNA nucleotidyltransferase [Rhodospirillales bacterium]|nr:CCA tRNA nucleotidyltransferase [Rhodospirillales bacterium]
MVSVPITEPVGKIPPQPWMDAPETREVLEALSAGGVKVRFIGGCVRDSLFKRPVRDIDIASPEPPEQIMAKLRNAGIKVIPTGIDHGTVTAVVDKASFEITTLRVDVETDGRRAKVAFTDDWVADAARRDFTFNALSCTPVGDVYDYFGGLEDLGRGCVRFVGRASERIAEDVLRLLRFFRFYAHYGRPPPDQEALAACRERARGLAVLSGERVRVETFRTLMANDPTDTFQLMANQKVLEHVLPEARHFGRLRLMTWLDTRAIRFDSVAPDPIRRLSALLAIDAKGAEKVADRLKMSNHQRARLVTMAAPPESIGPDVETSAVRRQLYHLGAEAFLDLALLTWAGELAVRPRLPHERTQAWISLIEAADTWIPPRFPLRGRDVMSLGVPHGPAIGELLKAVERWWEDDNFHADHDTCLKKLQTLITNTG